MKHNWTSKALIIALFLKVRMMRTSFHHQRNSRNTLEIIQEGNERIRWCSSSQQQFHNRLKSSSILSLPDNRILDDGSMNKLKNCIITRTISTPQVYISTEFPFDARDDELNGNNRNCSAEMHINLKVLVGDVGCQAQLHTKENVLLSPKQSAK